MRYLNQKSPATMPAEASKLSPASLAQGVRGVKELLPGDLALGFSGDQFKTLLGSCVSVILTDPRRTVATMCHIVHVSPPSSVNATNTAYGEVAMREMFRLLGTVGIVPRLCHAFVYGGGNMFPAHEAGSGVGGRNARWVMNYLRECDIEVLDHALEGTGYRRVSWTVGVDQPLVEMVAVQPEVPHAR